MLPLAHILALIFYSLFLVNKIRLPIVIFLSSVVVFFILIGSKKKVSCICHIYLCAAAIMFSPNFFIPCVKLYVCIKLQACKSSITSKSVLMCNIVILMIYNDSKFYSLVCSAIYCKYFHICGGTLTLLFQCLSWLSS